MNILDRIFTAWRALARRLDARALLLLAALGGSLAWFLPWPALVLFLPLAALSAGVARALLPGGRAALKAALFFTLFWGVSYFLLQIWEHWGEAGSGGAALGGALVFAGRLLAVFGLAALAPLCVSALTAGRALCWYIETVGRILPAAWRGRVKALAWQAGLGLALMAAFLPRAFRALSALRLSLKLRAPYLPAHRRFWLLGLALLRLLGAQSWEMSVSIAARDLYRAEAWRWREPL